MLLDNPANKTLRKGTPCSPWRAKLTCSSKSCQHWNTILNNCNHMIRHHRESRVSHEKMSIFWKVTVSVIRSKEVYICTCALFRTVSKIDLFHCTVHGTLHRRATRHVLVRVPECTDVDSGVFGNVLHHVNCTTFVTWTINTGIRNSM
jgi:hypothetical protein